MTYKVWVLNNNSIENIFVFGDKKEAFSEEDRDTMMEFGITEDAEIIIESPVQIHKDDSVMQIKKKILNEFGKESGVAYHELHLFAYTEKFIDPYVIFYDTVPKNKNYLNRDTCAQLLRNLLDEFDPLEKEIYTYNDFAEIVGHPKIQNVSIGLGMLHTNDYLFSPNPFYATEFTPRNIVHTDNVLLFSHGKIANNNIYVCLAGDVFAANPSQTEFMTKTYYPLLASKSVFDMESLLGKHQQLVFETDKMMDRRHFNSYQIVDMFYNIYENSSLEKTTEQLEYTENGVRRFEIALNPSYSFVMPLEIIFKNLHATPKYKYMKLNLGMRRENIYRLYSNKISKTGRKIPALRPEKINSLAKNTGKQKQLSIYADDQDLYIDIENDGTIVVSWESKKKTSIKIREIEKILIEDVNPLLETLNQCLQNSGYVIPMIQSIEDPNIEIKSMDYVASIVLNKKTKSKKIELKRDIGCLYSLFDIVHDFDQNQNAHLRFKRVNNYREMDQQTLLITETFNKKGRESDVLEALMLNHNMTIDEAGARIAEYLKNAEYREIEGNAIEIVDNPGFPIELSIKKNKDLVSKSELEFTVREISHLGYIESLSVYFESMMRLIQDIRVPGIPKEEINGICKPTRKEEIHIEEEIVFKPQIRERVAAFDFSPSSPGIQDYEEEGSKAPSILNTLIENAEEVKEDYILDEDSDDLSMTGIEQEDSDDFDMTGIEQEGGTAATRQDAASAVSSENSEEDVYVMKNKERAKNTNPFLMELQRKDPAVILQGKDKRSNIYSRSCQSYRQPVVLTAEEKARIDRKSPGSYTKAMKYGSTPENEHYYICPRYWCFKTNTSVNDPSECANGNRDYLYEFKNQANPIEHTGANGEYIHHYPGFIKKQGLKHCMPCCFGTEWDTWKKDPVKNKWINQSKTVRWTIDGKKMVRKGKKDWTEENVENKEKVDENGTLWIMDETTGKWIVNENEKQRPRGVEKCEDDEESEDESKQSESPVIGKIPVLNPDTKKVPIGKIAFLQYAVQHFMNVDYEGKYTTINNANNLNEGVQIFVRYGVGKGTHSGLLDCIADLLDIPVGQVGKHLADTVTIDNFVKFGNASFTALFRPPTIEIGNETIIKDNTGEKWHISANGPTKDKTNISYPSNIASVEINPDNYSNTELYKTMKSLSEESALPFLESMAAFELYKLYLMDPMTVVDYTYIWDLVSMPNPKLFEKVPNPKQFEKGLNMVIMEMQSKDITDSIDLICPTNTYSKTKFDINKPTTFIIKSSPTQDEKIQYEPVYMFDEKTRQVTRTFTKTTTNLKPLLRMLNRTLNNYCKPKQSMPDVYEFKQPILLEDLISILRDLSYTIMCQVLNYQHKTIALQVQNPKTNKRFCVPCNPSAPIANTEKKYMDVEGLWNDYETTRNELDALHKASQQKIPCNPMLKMIEDRTMIIGILTWSNQMVPINPPVGNVSDDGLKTMATDKHAADADVILTKITEGNQKRLEIIRNAKLENQMYSLFRSTIKSLLARPENHKHRDFLLVETRTQRPRKESLQNIIKRLIKITRGIVTFEDFDEKTRTSMGKQNEILYTCKKNTKSALLRDGCTLILPLNNLLLPTRDNRLLYYYRIADELLRFKQYSNFILNPKQILNTGNTEYKVNMDEFIVLESSLTSNYYENQSEFAVNKYMSGEIPYEYATAEKQITEPNVISLDVQNEGNANVTIDLLHNCIEEMTDLVGDPNVIFWIKDVFKVKKGNSYEMHFKPTVECSFGPVLKMLKDTNNININNIDDVREMLWESYKDIIAADEENLKKIVNILKDRQGKSAMMANVDSAAKFEEKIRNRDYFMTTMDLYVIAQKMELPVILFTNNNKDNTVNSLDDLGFEYGNWLIMGKQSDKSAENKFYFVRAQKKINPKIPVSIPAHSMVYRAFAISELNALKERIQSTFQKGDWANNMMTVEEFLK